MWPHPASVADIPCAWHSGQRWRADAPTQCIGTGWQTGFEPVAIKMLPDDASGVQERENMWKVQHAMQQQPGPHHVAELLNSFNHRDSSEDDSTILLVTR